jgi:hypothetical protein
MNTQTNNQSDQTDKIDKETNTKKVKYNTYMKKYYRVNEIKHLIQQNNNIMIIYRQLNKPVSERMKELCDDCHKKYFENKDKTPDDNETLNDLKTMRKIQKYLIKELIN